MKSAETFLQEGLVAKAGKSLSLTIQPVTLLPQTKGEAVSKATRATAYDGRISPAAGPGFLPIAAALVLHASPLLFGAMNLGLLLRNPFPCTSVL